MNCPFCNITYIDGINHVCYIHGPTTWIWCNGCGEPFDPDFPGRDMCPECWHTELDASFSLN